MKKSGYRRYTFFPPKGRGGGGGGEGSLTG